MWKYCGLFPVGEGCNFVGGDDRDLAILAEGDMVPIILYEQVLRARHHQVPWYAFLVLGLHLLGTSDGGGESMIDFGL